MNNFTWSLCDCKSPRQTHGTPPLDHQASPAWIHSRTPQASPLNPETWRTPRPHETCAWRYSPVKRKQSHKSQFRPVRKNLQAPKIWMFVVAFFCLWSHCQDLQNYNFSPYNPSQWQNIFSPIHTCLTISSVTSMLGLSGNGIIIP